MRHTEAPGVRPLLLLYVEQEWGERKRGVDRQKEGGGEKGGVRMLRGGGSCQGFTLRVLSEGKNKPENLGCLQVLKHF